jgi:orotate phosphoribosyltransferase-like protein
MYDYELVLRSKQLKSQGLHDRDIAEMLGVSVQTVRHWRYGTRQALAPEDRVHDTFVGPKF